MTGLAVIGADEPDSIAPLLEVYLERFLKAAGALGGESAEARARRAVIVWCKPR